jgi:hypothetical protein
MYAKVEGREHTAISVLQRCREQAWVGRLAVDSCAALDLPRLWW